MKKVVYISSSESQSIEVWNLYNNGSMHLIQTVETYSPVQPINIIKNKKLLYAGVAKENQIITYDIDTNGLLCEKNIISFPGKANYLSFDKNKKLLFCSSYHANALIVSKLDENGLPKRPMQIIHNIYGCHAAKVNYKYNVLFITSLKEDCIYLYYLTDFGVLKDTEQKILYSQKQSGPRHITFHPNQDFMYTINELNGTIDIWKIYNQENIVQVKNIQNIYITNNKSITNYWSSDIHITSCGRFLYAADRHLSIISLFHIDEHNKTIVFVESYATDLRPRSFHIDPENQYLIIAGEQSNTLIVYNISQDNGTLNKKYVYQTGHRPIWVFIHNLD